MLQRDHFLHSCCNCNVKRKPVSLYLHLTHVNSVLAVCTAPLQMIELCHYWQATLVYVVCIWCAFLKQSEVTIGIKADVHKLYNDNPCNWPTPPHNRVCKLISPVLDLCNIFLPFCHKCTHSHCMYTWTKISQPIHMYITFSSFCLFTYSKPDAVYEDPQLQDNPAYGTGGSVKVVKGEEDYETCIQWHWLHGG